MSGHDISLANNMSGHDINAVSENEQMAFYAIPNYSSSNKKDELKEILDRVAPDYERALKNSSNNKSLELWQQQLGFEIGSSSFDTKHIIC